MRRLSIEISVEEISQFIGNTSLDKIKSLETLNFLRFTPESTALVCKLELIDKTATIEESFNDPTVSIQVLEQEIQGTFICFISKKRPDRQLESINQAFGMLGGYLMTPYEIRDGKAKFTFVGTPDQVELFLNGFEQVGLHAKVNALTNALFLPISPLSHLTEKQRNIMMMAFRLGYYDIPRKIDSQALADKLNIRRSTLVMHRRRAEKRIFKELFKEFP